MLLFILGGLGPSLAGVILTYVTQDSQGWRDFWRRVIGFKRIGAGWYAVIFLLFPILIALALLQHVLTGGNMPQFETAASILSQPWTIFPIAILTLVIGPLPEELGWRGYALDRLQERWNALVSSLILGTGWALWHLPLFFTESDFQYLLGFGSLHFWLFCITMIVVSVLFTWIYNNNGRSILSAVLFHFMINLSVDLFILPDRAEVYQLILLIIVTIAVVLIWGTKTLTFSREK